MFIFHICPARRSTFILKGLTELITKICAFITQNQSLLYSAQCLMNKTTTVLKMFPILRVSFICTCFINIAPKEHILSTATHIPKITIKNKLHIFFFKYVIPRLNIYKSLTMTNSLLETVSSNFSLQFVFRDKLKRTQKILFSCSLVVKRVI